MRNSVYLLTAVGLATWMMVLTGAVRADADSIGVCVELPIDELAAALNPTLIANGQEPIEDEQYVGLDLGDIFGAPIPQPNDLEGTIGHHMIIVDYDDTPIVRDYTSDSTAGAEAECCAEAGLPPDCFSPVGE